MTQQDPAPTQIWVLDKKTIQAIYLARYDVADDTDPNFYFVNNPAPVIPSVKPLHYLTRRVPKSHLTGWGFMRAFASRDELIAAYVEVLEEIDAGYAKKQAAIQVRRGRVQDKIAHAQNAILWPQKA